MRNYKKIKIPTKNGRQPHPKWKTISPKMEGHLTQNYKNKIKIK